MFLKIIYRIFSLILLMILMQQVSLSYEACDTLRACIGRSLKFTVNSGKGAHYIDVINNDLIKKVSQTMTFELWLKPQKQAGKIQYIGGLWGPNFEINDSWLVYIDKDDSLVFQLNGPDPNIGVEDFTVVKYYLGNLYDTWNHYAFVFNGKNNKAYIYFNGTPVDSAINNKYPLYAPCAYAHGVPQ